MASPTWAADAKARTERPNFVVILADDLGYGDLACYGNPIIKTPHLDRLAQEGLKLTSCYAGACNCSPSRCAMLTGRNPYRAGIYNWIPEDSPVHLRKTESTIAKLLQQAGYSTVLVGKWHLNGKFNAPDHPQPNAHGFDYWFATQNNAEPSHHEPVNFVRNGKPVGPLQGYSSTIIVDEAIHWLKEVRKDDAKPFALFVWLHAPHEPIATPEKFTSMYPKVETPSQAVYYGNVTMLDDEVGRLLKTLDDLKLRDNSMVFFTSDNGPAHRVKHPHGVATPLRGKKNHLYEGGIRVPGIVRFPARIKPGVSDEPLGFVDLLPTTCELAGITIPENHPKLDGASFVPVFEDKPIVRTTPLYWQMNRSDEKPKVAMRVGDWKLLATLTGPELKPAAGDKEGDLDIMKKAELDRFELYNLKDDIAESKDLAEKEPEKLKTLTEQMRKLYDEIKKEGPMWPAWERPKKPK
jgi:arylsulfatase A